MTDAITPTYPTYPTYPTTFYTSSPAIRDPFSCERFCDNSGGCSLTGPKMTAVCSCLQRYRGTYCEEEVLTWFNWQFLVGKDGRLTGNGLMALICIGISIAILTFTGVVVYRRYKVRKNKTQEKQNFEHNNNNPEFGGELQVSSQQQLLVYQVTQPTKTTSPPPAPCSPQGQGICYLVPTSPEPTPEAAWQDFHNPGYRQSYIDSGI